MRVELTEEQVEILVSIIGSALDGEISGLDGVEQKELESLHEKLTHDELCICGCE